MAGRPPKPTELLLLSGAARKNPKRMRARADEPIPPSPNIGPPPADWMIFHPGLGYQRAEKLRALWDERAKLWPWLTISDRDALADYCELMLEKKTRKLSGSELTFLRGTRSDLGGNAVGRIKLGQRASGASSSALPAKSSDPRASFLLRKSG